MSDTAPSAQSAVAPTLEEIHARLRRAERMMRHAVVCLSGQNPAPEMVVEAREALNGHLLEYRLQPLAALESPHA